MASKTPSKDQQNFIWISIACVDFLKLPLKGILDNQIKPADLYQRIKSSPTNGKDYLRKEQLNICFIPPPGQPDYNDFDVTLLYTLIRNLCCTLPSPTLGWGNVPDSSHTQIGDDIERLRLMRNKFAHANSAGIPDAEFQAIWNDLKSVIQRIQTFMNSMGCNVNYDQKLADIERSDFGFGDLQKYKSFLEATLNLLKQEGIKDEPEISIKGAERVVCGEKTCFEADLKQEEISHWSISWQRVRGSVTNQIDMNEKKYRDSTKSQLVIHSVCKDDEGEYQAVLTRESNGNKRKIESNAIFLRVAGEPPKFEDWEVTTGDDGIIIQYEFKNSTPNVTIIEWTKNGEEMDFKNPRYVGGGLLDSCLTITSPSEVDKGTYSCTVKNYVGSTSKNVILDIPSAAISIHSKVYFGSKSNIMSHISSTPPPNKAEWQKSVDGDVFYCIDTNEPEYVGSYPYPEYPSLVIKNTTFENMLYYRLLVWNGIGECVSNTVFLDVTGNPPNITISHETCFQSRSLKLIAKVFPYDKCHATQDVFWTLNGEKIDKQGLGGKYSTVSVDDPSLTIHNVNSYDAGSYKLTATNAVGSTTSDTIDINIPDVLLTKFDEKENGSQWFTLTIKSIPEPFLVQWSKKEKNADTVQLINVHAEEFKGSSCSLPHPVLVVKQREQLDNYYFQIEVKSFIGTCTKKIQDFLDCVDLTNMASGIMDLDTASLDKDNEVSLSDWYEDEGAGIRFATLFEDLADHFPEKKIEKLRDIIQNSNTVKNNIDALNDAESARDFLKILQKENLFSQLDVTFVQFLLRKTQCTELENKCIEFAKGQRALGFYEIPPEDGFEIVKFHVLGDLSNFNQENRRKLRKTVAAIVGCNTDRVLLNGYCHSNSFIALLSIEVIYVKKVVAIQKQDKYRFEGLNIDYLTVDFITVYLRLLKESKRVVFREIMPTEEDLAIMSPLQQSSSVEHKTYEYIHKVKEKRINESNFKLSSSKHNQHNQPKATLIASICGSSRKINHISCLGSDRLWISSRWEIKEIDENGHLLRQLDVSCKYSGQHTVTKDGNLLFVKDGDIHMLTSSGEVRNLQIYTYMCCIHSSRINCDILVSNRRGYVKRYDKEGRLQRLYQVGQSWNWYDRIMYVKKSKKLKWFDRNMYEIEWKMMHNQSNITENINGDIIVTDDVFRKVDAVNSDGHHRFTYHCSRDHYDFEHLLDDMDLDNDIPPPFLRNRLDPIGICNDLSGHLLVGDTCYEDSGVHLLDEDGQILAKLLTHQRLNFSVLCVDDRNNLYIVNDDRINVYTYSSDTTTKDHDTALIEIDLKPKAIQI